MAKIGVLTMNRVINYGSILQTYATQYIIEKLGHECEIIDYRYPNEFHIKRGREVAPLSFKSKVLKFLAVTPRWRKIKAFRQFQRQYLHLSREYVSPDDIKGNPPEYDIYMSGSDQVWNPKYIYGDTTFLLDFVPAKNKKISYASSFSTNEIPSANKREYVQFLSQFDHISVRERNGAALVKDLLGREASVNLDPTLLLSSDEWDKICDNHPISKRPYILVYILTYAIGEMPYLNDLIHRVKKEMGIQTVFLGNRMRDIDCDRFVSYCSPTQFVRWIKGASYVITTSFHGTAFSVNYDIPFTSIVDNEADDRIMTLLREVGAEKCALKRDAPPLSISYNRHNEHISERLCYLREKNIDSLKRNIEE